VSSGQNPEFEKWSPHKHAANFKTPNLIIHYELDFRVPIGEGQALFTTLQRKCREGEEARSQGRAAEW
jgi:dipeptidyl aminopeptidase/acylaminoacyl peptidase